VPVQASPSDASSIEELIGGIIVEHRAKILGGYEELLVRADTPVSSPVPARDLHRQAEDLLDDVCRRLLATGSAPPEPAPPHAIPGASPHVPPSDSLRAAGALCEAVLTTVADQLPDRPDLRAGLVGLAVTLHRVTAERLATGALAYLGYLLEHLHRSHADERRRVARELHDLVAHSVAVALQNLELYAVHRDARPDRAARKLATALDTLRATADMVRALAQDLRRSGAEEGLERALRDCAASLVPEDVACRILFTGDEEYLPPSIRGEVFLILREGLRNACQHSGASRIDVRVAVGRHAVRADVIDNGRGLDAGRRTWGTGLASMLERAALLAGVVEVSGREGRGTTVHLEVPLKARDEPG
jgi:signal transduction histidine kinase